MVSAAESPAVERALVRILEGPQFEEAMARALGTPAVERALAPGARQRAVRQPLGPAAGERRGAEAGRADRRGARGPGGGYRPGRRPDRGPGAPASPGRAPSRRRARAGGAADLPPAPAGREPEAGRGRDPGARFRPGRRDPERHLHRDLGRDRAGRLADRARRRGRSPHPRRRSDAVGWIDRLGRLPALLLVALRPDARDAVPGDLTRSGRSCGGSAFAGRSVGWSASRLAIIPFCAGFLGILFSERRRGFQDRIADTEVVYVELRERAAPWSAGIARGLGAGAPPDVRRPGSAARRRRATASTFSAASRAIASRARSVAEPMCGSRTQRGASSSSPGHLAARPRRRRGRPPRSRPSRSASASAAESTSGPARGVDEHGVRAASPELGGADQARRSPGSPGTWRLTTSARLEELAQLDADGAPSSRSASGLGDRGSRRGSRPRAGRRAPRSGGRSCPSRRRRTSLRSAPGRGRRPGPSPPSAPRAGRPRPRSSAARRPASAPARARPSRW